MKAISTALQAHLDGEHLTLAHCWKVTRRDGVILGFTDHDKFLEIDGVVYQAASGFTPTAVASQSSLAVDNLDVEGLLDAGNITEQDILAGLYDFAEIEIFAVNYKDLTQGRVALRKGWLGEIELRNQQFVAEVRGITQQLSQHIGELYSPVCRAQFGDSRCKIDASAHEVSGVVTEVESKTVFSDSARAEENGTYNLGIVRFTSGANSGISREVKLFEDSVIMLALPMPYAIAAGDVYVLQKGCDKTLNCCITRYDNAVNFRGEPHVPGLDKMLETSQTRSE